MKQIQNIKYYLGAALFAFLFVVFFSEYFGHDAIPIGYRFEALSHTLSVLMYAVMIISMLGRRFRLFAFLASLINLSIAINNLYCAITFKYAVMSLVFVILDLFTSIILVLLSIQYYRSSESSLYLFKLLWLLPASVPLVFCLSIDYYINARFVTNEKYVLFYIVAILLFSMRVVDYSYKQRNIVLGFGLIIIGCMLTVYGIKFLFVSDSEPYSKAIFGFVTHLVETNIYGAVLLLLGVVFFVFGYSFRKRNTPN